MKERKNVIQLTGQATLAMASRTMYKEPSFKQKAAVMDIDEAYEQGGGSKPILMKGATYHEKQDEKLGSLERFAQAIMMQPNKTMSMWRPNLSQIARDEAQRIVEYSPKGILNRLRKSKNQLPKVQISGTTTVETQKTSPGNFNVNPHQQPDLKTIELPKNSGIGGE
jgi:hypothetical protein